MRKYRCTKVYGDRYGGEWPREQFRKHGVNYEPSEKTKSDIYIEICSRSSIAARLTFSITTGWQLRSFRLSGARHAAEEIASTIRPVGMMMLLTQSRVPW